MTDLPARHQRPRARPGRRLRPRRRDRHRTAGPSPACPCPTRSPPTPSAARRTSSPPTRATPASTPGYVEADRVKDLGKDDLQPALRHVDPALQADANLGRLNVTTATATPTATGYDSCTPSAAARSRSGPADGELVFDSGADSSGSPPPATRRTSTPTTRADFDNRSDDKGPEPEGVAVGKIDGRTYAFVGLERVGGVVVYDVTEPSRRRS